MNKKQKILTALALAAFLLSMYAWDVQIFYPYHYKGGDQFLRWNEWVRWDDLSTLEKFNYGHRVYTFRDRPGVFFRDGITYPAKGNRFVRFDGDTWAEIPANGWSQSKSGFRQK